MSWLLNQISEACNAVITAIPEPRIPLPRPRAKLHRPNRVDADPRLIAYHGPLAGLKPPLTPTPLLPLRTDVPKDFLDEMTMAQSHAYYEEIDSVPAAVVGLHSRFHGKGGGHWYVIHPLDILQVMELSSRVLGDLKTWIEASEDVYVGEHNNLVGFREVREETLQLVKRELERRGVKTTVGETEGYLGEWEDIGEESGKDAKPVEEARPKVRVVDQCAIR